MNYFLSQNVTTTNLKKYILVIIVGIEFFKLKSMEIKIQRINSKFVEVQGLITKSTVIRVQRGRNFRRAKDEKGRLVKRVVLFTRQDR